MRALDNKEALPFDLMSQILSIVRELCRMHLSQDDFLTSVIIHVDTEKNVDMEDLVDEFLMFYFAGKPVQVCACGGHILSVV